MSLDARTETNTFPNIVEVFKRGGQDFGIHLPGVRDYSSLKVGLPDDTYLPVWILDANNGGDHVGYIAYGKVRMCIDAVDSKWALLRSDEPDGWFDNSGAPDEMWLVPKHHAAFGFGNPKVNQGLPEGVTIEDLRTGRTLTVRFTDRPASRAIFLQFAGSTGRGVGNEQQVVVLAHNYLSDEWTSVIVTLSQIVKTGRMLCSSDL